MGVTTDHHFADMLARKVVFCLKYLIIRLSTPFYRVLNLDDCERELNNVKVTARQDRNFRCLGTWSCINAIVSEICVQKVLSVVLQKNAMSSLVRVTGFDLPHEEPLRCEPRVKDPVKKKEVPVTFYVFTSFCVPR